MGGSNGFNGQWQACSPFCWTKTSRQRAAWASGGKWMGARPEGRYESAFSLAWTIRRAVARYILDFQTP